MTNPELADQILEILLTSRNVSLDEFSNHLDVPSLSIKTTLYEINQVKKCISSVDYLGETEPRYSLFPGTEFRVEGFLSNGGFTKEANEKRALKKKQDEIEAEEAEKRRLEIRELKENKKERLITRWLAVGAVIISLVALCKD